LRPSRQNRIEGPERQSSLVLKYKASDEHSAERQEADNEGEHAGVDIVADDPRHW
jgi:hypothetical protein